MERRQIIIKDGATTLVTALEYANGESGPVVTNMTGWDDFSAVQITTAEKLSGMGSYEIGYHIGEREVLIEINFSSSTVTNLLNTLKTKMMNFTPLVVDRVFYDDATEKRRERLTGKLRGVGWERVGSNATIALTFLFSNPEKLVFLDGSSSSSGTAL